MDLLKTLDDATTEQLKEMSPFSGLMLVNQLRKDKDAKLKLLGEKPKFRGGQYPKVGFVFEYNAQQHLLKFDNSVKTEEVKLGQDYNFEIRDFDDKGTTRYYVVATL